MFLTLGLSDTVDYLLTGDEATPEHLASEASEQLVRLSGLGMALAQPHPITEEEIFHAVSTHSVFNVRHLYLVSRSLISIHPAFDKIIGRILSKDVDGEIMIIYEKHQELWLERTRSRLRKGIFTRSVYNRIRFVKRMDQRALWALMSVADVILDTFPIGAGATAIEAYVLKRMMFSHLT